MAYGNWPMGFRDEIDDLETNLKNWDLDASVDKKMRELKGPVRETIMDFLSDTFGESFTADSIAGMGSEFNHWLRDLMTIDDAAAQSIEEAANAVKTTFYMTLEQVIGEDNTQILYSAAETLGFTDWDLFGLDVQKEIIASLSEVYGSPRRWPSWKNWATTSLES